MNLDTVLSQQTELHNLLDALEREVDRTYGPGESKPRNAQTQRSEEIALPDSLSSPDHILAPCHTFFSSSFFVGLALVKKTNPEAVQGGLLPRTSADLEREQTHELALGIMQELDAMAVTLKDVVQDINQSQVSRFHEAHCTLLYIFSPIP